MAAHGLFEGLKIITRNLVTESTGPGSNDPFIGIESRHTADRNPLSPVSIRHAERIATDARQARDIRDLLEHAAVHIGQDRVIRIDSGRHAHAFLLRRWDFPNLIRDALDPLYGVELHRDISVHHDARTTHKEAPSPVATCRQRR